MTIDWIKLLSFPDGPLGDQSNLWTPQSSADSANHISDVKAAESIEMIQLQNMPAYDQGPYGYPDEQQWDSSSEGYQPRGYPGEQDWRYNETTYGYPGEQQWNNTGYGYPDEQQWNQTDVGYPDGLPDCFPECFPEDEEFPADTDYFNGESVQTEGVKLNGKLGKFGGKNGKLGKDGKLGKNGKNGKLGKDGKDGKLGKGGKNGKFDGKLGKGGKFGKDGKLGKLGLGKDGKGKLGDGKKEGKMHSYDSQYLMASEDMTLNLAQVSLPEQAVEVQSEGTYPFGQISFAVVASIGAIFYIKNRMKNNKIKEDDQFSALLEA